MKKLSFIVSAICLLCPSVPDSAYGREKTSGTADTLTVMSYNLRFGELASMEEIGDYISAKSPDIVALQECDWATYRERAPRQNGVKFINELAHATGMFGIYGKSIDYRGGYYGIGILSRYPIIRSERILLPNPESKEQRSMLVADIELPGGRVVTFACTHLEVSSSDSRMCQVRFIEKQLSGKGVFMLAGDMNARPESPEMQYLCRKWKNLTNDGLTYSTRKPVMKIDYIYGKPENAFELLSTCVSKDTELSDHYPVISEIIIH
ncbi:MAG: endonuclease/exonuclease/phosphatase family protein [Bacteroidales bacterium]|nr:endonuclease/exonuclease/phosphatase family protein [Bacteroidales bacterium]